MFLNIGIDKDIMNAALSGDAAAQGVYRQAVKVAALKAALSAAKRLVELEQAEEHKLLNAYNRGPGGVMLPPEYIEGGPTLGDLVAEERPGRKPTMCGDSDCDHPGH